MIDLKKIEEEFLQQCGSCDAGLPMACAHSDRDYRPTMLELVVKVKDLYDALGRIEADWNRERTARLEAEEESKALRKQRKASERAWAILHKKVLQQVLALEEALAVSADELLTYKDYYGTSPAQVKHLAECNVCAVLPPQLPEYCPDYPSE